MARVLVIRIGWRLAMNGIRVMLQQANRLGRCISGLILHYLVACIISAPYSLYLQFRWGGDGCGRARDGAGDPGAK